MKNTFGLLVVLLVAWSGASTYWYVCKIKKDCDKEKKEIISKTDGNKVVNGNNDIKKETANIVDTTSNVIDTVSVVKDIEEKLKGGYTLYNFPINSALKEDVGEDFDVFAENLKIYLQKNEAVKIRITGYTDNTGTPAINYKTGMKRAGFMKNKLIEKGISESRIIIFSKGEKNPIADNKTAEGRNKNRRAVIEIINN